MKRREFITIEGRLMLRPFVTLAVTILLLASASNTATAARVCIGSNSLGSLGTRSGYWEPSRIEGPAGPRHAAVAAGRRCAVWTPTSAEINGVACDARRKTIKKTLGKQGVDQVNGRVSTSAISQRPPARHRHRRAMSQKYVLQSAGSMQGNAGFLGFALENACAWRGERNRQKAQLF